MASQVSKRWHNPFNTLAMTKLAKRIGGRQGAVAVRLIWWQNCQLGGQCGHAGWGFWELQSKKATLLLWVHVCKSYERHLRDQQRAIVGRKGRQGCRTPEGHLRTDRFYWYWLILQHGGQYQSKLEAGSQVTLSTASQPPKCLPTNWKVCVWLTRYLGCQSASLLPFCGLKTCHHICLAAAAVY